MEGKERRMGKEKVITHNKSRLGNLHVLTKPQSDDTDTLYLCVFRMLVPSGFSWGFVSSVF